jgi:hypothetical protein
MRLNRVIAGVGILLLALGCWLALSPTSAPAVGAGRTPAAALTARPTPDAPGSAPTAPLAAANGSPVDARPAAEPAQAVEPTAASCAAAMDEARELAVRLPEGDGSKLFAMSYLRQAGDEAANSEYDECLLYASQAADEVRERRHQLQPGERIVIRSANE